MSVIFDEDDKGRKHTHLVFIGHLDHGKSSILGRLFYDTNNVGKETMERIRTMAEEFGKKGFEYAFIMDQIKEERTRGITIGLAHKKLATEKTSFTFADAPGHKDFVRNMLVGASEAEGAVLVIAADEGIQSQTKQHLFLSKMMGVPRIIVAVNKMDLVEYKKQRFDELKEGIHELIKKFGYDPQEVPIVPCSAMEGENIVKKSEKMTWYESLSLLELLENLPEKKIPIDLPLRLPVQDIYEIDGEQVVIGKLNSGKISSGEEIMIMPLKKKYKIKEIWKQDEKIEKAIPDDNIYLYLNNLQKDEIVRGNIVGKEENPPTMTSKITAQIMVINYAEVVKQGFEAVFDMLTEEVPCKITKLLERIDTRSGETFDNPSEIKNDESAVVVIETQKPVYVEKQSDIPHLSKFRLWSKGKSMAIGVCVGVD